MDQFDKCGAVQLMQVLDSGLSNLPATIGSFLSTGTQTAIGWSDRDTAIFIAKDEITLAYKYANWEGVGQGVMLGLSQILKYEAPAAAVEVAPTTS